MPPLQAKLVPAHEIHRRFKYFWQYLQFSPRAARIFANIEYWPLLNADELAPNIEYWLYIERGNIILRHSINQFPKTRNFDVIVAEAAPDFSGHQMAVNLAKSKINTTTSKTKLTI